MLQWGTCRGSTSQKKSAQLLGDPWARDTQGWFVGASAAWSACVWGLYTLQSFAECVLAPALSQRSIKRGSKGSRRWQDAHPLIPRKVQATEMTVWFQPWFYFQSPNYILKSFSPLIFFQSRKVLGGDLPEMKSLCRCLGIHLSFKHTASATENSSWVKSHCQR